MVAGAASPTALIVGRMRAAAAATDPRRRSRRRSQRCRRRCRRHGSVQSRALNQEDCSPPPRGGGGTEILLHRRRLLHHCSRWVLLQLPPVQRWSSITSASLSNDCHYSLLLHCLRCPPPLPWPSPQLLPRCRPPLMAATPLLPPSSLPFVFVCFFFLTVDC